MIFHKSLLLVLAFLSIACWADVVDLIQAAWSKTQTYRADFHQTITSKTLGTREETKGVLTVKKPLQLRWETSTTGQIQILNKDQFWLIKPHKRKKVRYVDHYGQVSKKVHLGALNFLAGAGELKKSYQYKVLQNTPKIVILALSPRGQSQETILAEFLKPSYLLGALQQENLESETQIKFQNVQTNLSLDKELFEYRPHPQDVVVNHE